MLIYYRKMQEFINTFLQQLPVNILKKHAKTE